MPTYARETWKLIIMLDLAALIQRYEQITKYLWQTECVTSLEVKRITISELSQEKKCNILKNVILQI